MGVALGYRYDRCDRCYRQGGVMVVRVPDEAPHTWVLTLLCGPCSAVVLDDDDP